MQSLNFSSRSEGGLKGLLGTSQTVCPKEATDVAPGPIMSDGQGQKRIPFVKGIHVKPGDLTVIRAGHTVWTESQGGGGRW